MPFLSTFWSLGEVKGHAAIRTILAFLVLHVHPGLVPAPSQLLAWYPEQRASRADQGIGDHTTEAPEFDAVLGDRICLRGRTQPSPDDLPQPVCP